MNLGIIVQARMGSSRLPGKVLKPIAGKPLLAHILDRLGYLQHKAHVVVATSNESMDEPIVAFCKYRDIDCFRGSESDVLARYYYCAKEYGFTDIVRLTADNPFVDIEELDRLITYHLSQGYDYTHSFEQMPIGVGAEIFVFPALEKSFFCGKQPNHREHVNEYIQENPELFRIGRLEVSASKNCPTLRLTIDTKEDYDRACALAEKFTHDISTTEHAILLCLHSA